MIDCNSVLNMAKKSLKKLPTLQAKTKQNLDDLLKSGEAEVAPPAEQELEPVQENLVADSAETTVSVETQSTPTIDSLLLATETQDNSTLDTTENASTDTVPDTNTVSDIDTAPKTTNIDELLVGNENKQPENEAAATITQEVSTNETEMPADKGGTSQLIADLKSKDDSEPAKPMSAAFHRPDTEANTHPLKNFQLIILATFGIGLLAFGMFQFIRNVSLNFASENTDETPGVTEGTTDQKPPHILSFQGRLSTANKEIVSPVPMEFSFYDTSGGNVPPPTGGNQLWTSGNCYVNVDKTGFFAVNLGAGRGNGHDDDNCGSDLGDIFSQHGSIWLQIQIRNEILFPRQLVKAVPYALNSDALDGYHASASATANSIPVINAEGNLVINTSGSAIINTGDLSLKSLDGDLYFLPGGGKVYIEGNLTISGQLAAEENITLTSKDGQTTIDSLGGSLTLRTSASQDLAANAGLTLSTNGNVGIGTTSPGQKLTIAQGNLGFDFLQAPSDKNFIATEDAITANGLTGLTVPSTALTLDLLAGDGGELAVGQHNYGVSFVSFDGSRYRETLVGAIANITVTDPETSVLISNIPTYPADNVVARKIYRTKADNEPLYLVATINDNLTTSLIDTSGDIKLTTLAPTTNDVNTYRYKATYVSPTGETNASAPTPIVSLSGNGRAVKLSNIPTDPSKTATARNIYRTLAGGETYYLVASIPDNSTTTLYDTIPDSRLLDHRLLADYNSTSGGLYAGEKKLIQLSDDGKIITDGQLIAGGRIETSHGDNQGLKLPTSIGKPVAKIGQKAGDIVFDTVSSILYIYNGQDFIAQSSGNNAGLVTNNPISGQNGSACHGNSCQVKIEPEYTGSVITASGDNYNGSLTTDHEIISGNLHYNYYLWQSTVAIVPQAIDILMSMTLPNDFESWQNEAIVLDYATQTTNALENNVSVTVYKNGGSSVSQANVVASTADTWMSNANSTQPLIISGAQLDALDLKAGDTIIVQITPSSENNHFVKLGTLALHYLGNQGVTVTDGRSYWHKLAGALFADPTAETVFFGGSSLDNAKIAMLGLQGSDATLAIKGNIFLNGDHDSYLDIASSNRFGIRAGEMLREMLTILPNGNVGINNANPQTTLDVGGSVAVAGSLSLAPISAAEAGECNSTTEGKLYYDVDQLNFFACTALDQSRTQFSWTALMRTAP